MKVFSLKHQKSDYKNKFFGHSKKQKSQEIEISHAISQKIKEELERQIKQHQNTVTASK